MSVDKVTVQQIYEQIQDLPQESLSDLAKYVEFLFFKARTDKQDDKQEQSSQEGTPYRVVARLEGILEGYDITEEDIAAARREMWGRFGEQARTEKPLRIIKLGGLWAGHEFTSEEIDQFRRELWAGFGEREL